MKSIGLKITQVSHEMLIILVLKPITFTLREQGLVLTKKCSENEFSIFSKRGERIKTNLKLWRWNKVHSYPTVGYHSILLFVSDNHTVLFPDNYQHQPPGRAVHGSPWRTRSWPFSPARRENRWSGLPHSSWIVCGLLFLAVRNTPPSQVPLLSQHNVSQTW